MKPNIFIKYVVVLFLMVEAILANAQQTITVNIESVLKLAGANNLTIVHVWPAYR